MSRFQAQTNSVMDAELEVLREKLGLGTHQKADLLREITALASWVVEQASAGRKIVAKNDSGELEELRSPALARVQNEQSERMFESVVLSEHEARRLGAILEGEWEPSPKLRALLRNLSEGREAPNLVWDGR